VAGSNSPIAAVWLCTDHQKCTDPASRPFTPPVRRHAGGMPHRLPIVLSHHDLPEAELHAAHRDGELFRVGDCFASIDEIERPIHRLLATHDGVPAGLIVDRLSAAWVWGALKRAPSPRQFCVPIGARLSLSPARRLAVREVVIDLPEDTVDLGGHLITTPTRTAVDLARESVRFEGGDRDILISLVRIGHIRLDACVAQLRDRNKMPNKRRAMARLESLAGSLQGQPELTRYTS